MIQLLILLLVLYSMSCVASLLWKIGRRVVVASAFFLLAGVFFPNPVAGFLLLGIGVAFLFFA